MASRETGRVARRAIHRPQNEPDCAERYQHGLREVNFEQPWMPWYPSPLYDYRRGAATFHVHFALRQGTPSGAGEGIDLCATIEKVLTVESERAVRATSDEDADRAAQGGKRPDGLLVLVDVFESAEDSDDMSVPALTSVRLRVYDDCLQEEGQAANGIVKAFPRIIVGEYEIPPAGLKQVAGLDWETRAVPIFWQRVGYHDVIECAAKVVYEVAQHHDEHRVKVVHRKPIAPPTALLSVWLSDTTDAVRLAFGVSPDCVPDLYHVALRTLELEPPRISHEGNLGGGQ